MNEAQPIYISVLACESIVKDESGLITAIRINDGYGITPFQVTAKDDTPLGIAYQPVQFVMLVSVRTEYAAGLQLSVKGFRPDGKPFRNFPKYDIDSKGGAEGNTMFINTRIDTADEGDYWFEFSVGDRLINKLPIRIRHSTPAVRLQVMPEPEQRRA